MVDAYFIKKIGRRKTWIIASEWLAGLTFIIVGFFIDE